MKQVYLYADGHCKGVGTETAAGSWSARLHYKENVKELAGFESGSSGNRMELTAVIEGLRALKVPCHVSVMSDSTYVINGACSLRSWMERNWTRKDGKPIANVDLWKEVLAAAKEGGHKVSFHYHKPEAKSQRGFDFSSRKEGEE